MDHFSITTKAKLWEYAAIKGAWHFVTLNKTAQKWVEQVRPKMRRGFGSIPVIVTIGSSTWKTSLFPDKMRGYVMPVKSKILKVQKLQEGDFVTLILKRDRAR